MTTKLGHDGWIVDLNVTKILEVLPPLQDKGIEIAFDTKHTSFRLLHVFFLAVLPCRALAKVLQMTDFVLGFRGKIHFSFPLVCIIFLFFSSFSHSMIYCTCIVPITYMWYLMSTVRKVVYACSLFMWIMWGSVASQLKFATNLP